MNDELNYWPSFVDIMSSLFVIFMLMFLVIFSQIGKGIKDIELLYSMLEENEFSNIQIEDGRLIIGSDILFATNKYEIKPEGKEKLLALGRQFQNFFQVQDREKKFTIIIEGHTDTAGSINYNDSLSYRRANSVVNLWRNELDLSISNNTKLDLIPVGYGEHRNKVKTEDETHLLANRRIEIRIVPKFDTMLEKILNFHRK